jgi:membrane protein YqaA with SNARE-associated domain
LVKFLRAFPAAMTHLLSIYGGWGLLGIAFLDSAGLSLPGVKDVMLIYLSGTDPSRAWLYALGCATGTAVGSFVIYWIGRSGIRVLRRKNSDKEMGRAMKWISRNDFVTVLVASLLPPPLPFKPFLLASGVLRISSVRLLTALMVGGALRFGAEAWIGVRFGAAGPAYLKKHIGLISLVTVGVIIGATVVMRIFQRARSNAEPLGSKLPPPPSSI